MYLHTVSTSTVGRSEVVEVTVSPLCPREGTPVTTEGEARWCSETFWSCFEMRKFPSSTEIKTPFRWALA